MGPDVVCSLGDSCVFGGVDETVIHTMLQDARICRILILLVLPAWLKGLLYCRPFASDQGI